MPSGRRICASHADAAGSGSATADAEWLRRSASGAAAAALGANPHACCRQWPYCTCHRRSSEWHRAHPVTVLLCEESARRRRCVTAATGVDLLCTSSGQCCSHPPTCCTRTRVYDICIYVCRHGRRHVALIRSAARDAPRQPAWCREWVGLPVRGCVAASVAAGSERSTACDAPRSRRPAPGARQHAGTRGLCHRCRSCRQQAWRGDWLPPWLTRSTSRLCRLGAAAAAAAVLGRPPPCQRASAAHRHAPQRASDQRADLPKRRCGS